MTGDPPEREEWGVRTVQPDGSEFTLPYVSEQAARWGASMCARGYRRIVVKRVVLSAPWVAVEPEHQP